MVVQRFYLYFCLFFLVVFVSVADAKEVPFTDAEMKLFCNEFPIILSHMDDQQKNFYFNEVMRTYKDARIEESVRKKANTTMSSERIAYILHHIILGGVIEDRGGFGKGHLKFMQNERKKVVKNNRIPSEDKKIILQELDRDIENFKKIIEETEAIPHSELALMWKHKDTLGSFLRNVVPVQKKRRKLQE